MIGVALGQSFISIIKMLGNGLIMTVGLSCLVTLSLAYQQKREEGFSGPPNFLLLHLP
jgi:hypothetical protein